MRNSAMTGYHETRHNSRQPREEIPAAAAMCQRLNAVILQHGGGRQDMGPPRPSLEGGSEQQPESR